MKNKVKYSDLLKIYSGSGNPKNSFWFIGMEWNGIDDNTLNNLTNYNNWELSECLNGECKIPCTNIRTFFGIPGLIVKELNYDNSIVIENGIENLDFNRNSNIFWTNTSLLGFKSSSNVNDQKNLFVKYKKYISGLEGHDYNNLFYDDDYLKIRKIIFRDSLNEKPKYIFVSGNSINYFRFLTLIDSDYKLKPTHQLKISYNSGRSKYSFIKFYSYNNIKFSISPFFSGRWYNPKNDVKRICNYIKTII